jgi:hypothetical protein
MAHNRAQLTFLGVDLWDWVRGTVDRVGEDSSPGAWNSAWVTTYKALGGKNPFSGTKGCPMKAAYTLYYLGRIEGTRRPALDWPLNQIRSQLTKNGVYAVLAIELLRENPTIGLNELWEQVRIQCQKRLGEAAAEQNAGAVTVAFKLFQAGKIRE